jgi:hypothetical protein
MTTPQHAVLTVEGNTNIYGYLVRLQDGGMYLIEMFATNPHAAGASELGAGLFHDPTNAREITKRHFNAAFLMDSEESIEEADATATLSELKRRDPDD